MIFASSGGGLNVSQQFHDISVGPIAESSYSDIDMQREGVCGNLYLVRRAPNGSYKALMRDFAQLMDNLYLAEQGVLDIFLQRYSGSLCMLDNHLYTPHPNQWPAYRCEAESESIPYFLHSWSRPKFWEQPTPHPYWLRYYDQWIALGGRSFMA